MPKKAGLIERAEEAKVDGSTAGRGKRGDGTFISGHCSTGSMVADELLVSSQPAREWHGGCRGSVVNGNGTVLVCACGCHSNHTVCRNCGRFDVEVITEGGGSMLGTCIDVEGCAEILAERAKSSPIRKFLTAEQEKRVAKRLRDDHPGLPGAKPADDPEGRREGTKTPRVRTKGTPQRCHCGCGVMTKGGNFAMGHDMKLKGRLFEAAREHGDVMATAEIVLRGWNEAGIKDAVRADARGELEAGIDLAHFVNKRYSGG